MLPAARICVGLSGSRAAVDAFAKAFEGEGVELIRSDLSVQEQDEVRAALGNWGAADQPQSPGSVPES